MAKENMPEYETIRAAVAGKKWAIEKVLECYSGELDKLATAEKKQLDGSIKMEGHNDRTKLIVG